MSVLIFANGQMNELEWARSYLNQATAVIAADGGVHHLLALSHRPDIVIGDMDSIEANGLSELKDEAVDIVTHPADKDETDLELALNYAVERYQDEILIFGALGGRLDQTVSNLLLLTQPSLRGRPIRLVERGQMAWIVDRLAEIDGEVGDIVSLIPLDDQVHINQTSGLKWVLENEKLSFGPARGVSNVMTAEKATVAILSGLLLCVHIFEGQRSK